MAMVNDKIFPGDISYQNNYDIYNQPGLPFGLFMNLGCLKWNDLAFLDYKILTFKVCFGKI